MPLPSRRSGRPTCRALRESFSAFWCSGTAWSRCSGIRKRATRRGGRIEGILELIAFPAALLIMLGLFTRPVSLVLSVLYFIAVFRRPAPAGSLHAPQRRRSDPAELFLLPLSGRGRRRRVESGSAAPPGQRGVGRFPVGAVRAGDSSHRGRLPVHHARPGEVLRRRRRTARSRYHDDARIRRAARNRRRTAHHPRPLHPSDGVHPVRRDGGGVLPLVGAERVLAKLRARRHGSVDSVLLPLSVSVGGRPRGLESRRSVAA